MKWIIALLVSAGMFYTGYQHAARYKKEEVEVPEKPEEKPTTTMVTPVPQTPSVAPVLVDPVVASIKEHEFALKEFPDLLDRADQTLSPTLARIIDQESQLKVLKRRRHHVESIDEAPLVAILDLIRQEAEIYKKAADHDPITALCRREFRTATDDVQHFMKLAGYYWNYSKSDAKCEKSALQLIGSRVKSNFGDNLKSSDWYAKGTAIKPHAQLAKFYREAGDRDRTHRLEKDLAKIREEMRVQKRS